MVANPVGMVIAPVTGLPWDVTAADLDHHGLRAPSSSEIAALADPAACTAVFMGRRTFPELARRIMAAGLPPETPALFAEAVSTPAESFTRTTVGELAERLAGAEPGPAAPALILYGALARGRG